MRHSRLIQFDWTERQISGQMGAHKNIAIFESWFFLLHSLVLSYRVTIFKRNERARKQTQVCLHRFASALHRLDVCFVQTYINLVELYFIQFGGSYF